MNKHNHSTQFLKQNATPLAERGWRLAYALLRDKQLAEDSVQEAFVVAVRKIGQLEGDPWPWFNTIVANEARNVRRKQSRRQVRLVNEATMSELVDDGSPFRELSRAEMLEQVSLAMQALPDDEEEALSLVYIGGLTYREAAKVMELSKSSIGRLVEHGQASLRMRLKRDDPDLKLLIAALPLIPMPNGLTESLLPLITDATAASMTAADAKVLDSQVSANNFSIPRLAGILATIVAVLAVLTLVIFGTRAMLEESSEPVTVSMSCGRGEEVQPGSRSDGDSRENANEGPQSVPAPNASAPNSSNSVPTASPQEVPSGSQVDRSDYAIPLLELRGRSPWSVHAFTDVHCDVSRDGGLLFACHPESHSVGLPTPGCIWGFSARDGSEQWRVVLPGEGPSLVSASSGGLFFVLVDGRVEIRSATTGDLVRDCGLSGVGLIGVSADARYFATVSTDSAASVIRIIETSNMTTVNTWEVDSVPVRVIFSKSGDYLYVLSDHNSGQLISWHLVSEKKTILVQGADHELNIEDVDVNADGTMALTKSATDNRYVISSHDLESGDVLASVTASAGGGFAMSPIGDVAVSTVGEELALWDPSSGRIMNKCEHSPSSVEQAWFSEDGAQLYAHDGQYTYKWATKSGKLVNEHAAVEYPDDDDVGTARVESGSRGQFLVSLTRQTIQTWSTATGELLSTIAYNGALEDMTICNDEIAALTMGNAIEFLDPHTGEQLRVIPTDHDHKRKYTDTCGHIFYSRIAGKLIGLSTRGMLVLWDISTGKITSTIRIPSFSGTQAPELAVSPSGYSVSVSDNLNVYQVNLVSADVECVYKGGAEFCAGDIQYSETGNELWIAKFGGGSSFMKIGLAERSQVRVRISKGSLPSIGWRIQLFRILPGGKYAVASHPRKTGPLLVIDLESNTVIKTLHYHRDGVLVIAEITSHQMLLVTAGRRPDPSMCIWDISSFLPD